jgi:putative hydrolase of the HAD superfamily
LQGEISLVIKAVIFDFGGVLVRTEHSGGRDKWETTLGLSRGELSQEVFNSEAAILASIGKVPEGAIWDHIGDRYHLSPTELAQLQEDFWSGDQLDEELVSYLRALRPRYKTAILSNAWSGARLTFREKYRLDEAVDLIVISAEEGLAKPDPVIFDLIARRLGVRPQEAIFVDDFPENICAAQESGFAAVQFHSTRQAVEEIEAIISKSE